MERPVAGEVAGGVAMSAAPTALADQEWRTLDEIAQYLRVSRREAEAMVEGWRLAGKPIVAGARGVKWTSDPAELARYLEARRRRMVSIYLGTRALRQTARRMKEAQDAAGGLTLWRDAA